MTDVHSKEKRSYNMSRIKGKDTKPEMVVRQFLFAKGLRYRLHDKKLPGKPDIIFSKLKTIVLIHGCFWHGHAGCRYFTIPKTRTEWWKEKISRNVNNDHTNRQKLVDLGWEVIEIWTCKLKKGLKEQTLKNLLDKLTEKRSLPDIADFNK